ncbi:MAG: zf-HC2 domain-containing protein [Planctomycetota bacterium]
MTKLWSKIVLILTLKCDQASLLESESLDRELKLYERLALKGHLLVCTVCRKLHRQLRFLDGAHQHLDKETPEVHVCKLSNDASQRIRQAMQEETGEASASE